MSQSKNKSGRRDISDLKARLGLKKGGPATKAQGGGVVAPPGLKKPSSVPVPPGARPPAPEIPSASDDPFAAMNAMAAVGTAQKAPEIIIVNDGKPVENVETKSKAANIGKWAGIVLVPLFLGIVLGQLSKSAKQVNNTIAAAGDLLEDVNSIRKATQDNILDPLLRAKERGENGTFKLNDEELTQQLSDKKAWPFVDPIAAFQEYMYDMDKEARADIMYFYSQSAELVKLVEEHVQKSEADAKLIAEGQKSIVEAKPDEDVNQYMQKAFSRYGVFVSVPTRDEASKGAEFGARVVEIGAPVCQDRKASTTGTCQGPPIGFSYRVTGAGEGWELKELGGPAGEESVSANKLLPLVATPVFEGLIKGSKQSLAEITYLQRVNELFEKASALVEYGTALENKLKAKSKQSKAFTFFL